MKIETAQIVLDDTDYKGRVFDQFHARQDSGTGPGWFIFGRNPEYGGKLVRLCGKPNRPRRRHVHYNGAVWHGWKTKRAALEALATIQTQTS